MAAVMRVSMRLDVKWRKQDQELHGYKVWDYWSAIDLRDYNLLLDFPIQQCTERVEVLW
jgi:hypothetical protein